MRASWRMKLLILPAALAAQVALAQTATPPPQASDAPAVIDRFSMTPAQGGFLRLDKQTGAVSFCTVEAGQSACRAGSDERASLEKEIADLRRENAELKTGLERGASPSGVSPLPKEEEFERALNFVERFFRRMMRILKEENSGDRI